MLVPVFPLSIRFMDKSTFVSEPTTRVRSKVRTLPHSSQTRMTRCTDEFQNKCNSFNFIMTIKASENEMKTNRSRVYKR